MIEDAIPQLRPITRRTFLELGVQGFAALGTSGLWGCSRSHQGETPRNVILISIDTLRADHLGCYGYPRPTSPAIDRLASGGVLLEDVSAPSPWTLPAHASMLTGLYPRRNGVRSRHDSLPDHVATLADILGRQGYRTSAVVNSHWLSRTNGLDKGFEEFRYVEEHVRDIAPRRVDREARRWLTAKGEGKPFFLFLHYYDVHSDYRALPQYEQQFARPYDGIADGSTAQLGKVRYGQIELDRSDVNHLIDLYDAGIRQLDDDLKGLFALLEERGLMENTLLVVTADHGEEFLEHGGVLHGRTHYQEVVRVPLILAGAGLGPPRREDCMASLIDVAPTILGLVGIKPSSALDGIDLSTWWRDPGLKQQRFLFGEADWNNLVEGRTVDDIKRAVRLPRYKLLYDLVTERPEMYDLSADPGEETDVLAEHGELAEIMLAQLREFESIERTTSEAAPALSPEEVERLESLGYLQ
jgi:arylsulfatase A-like enzyme